MGIFLMLVSIFGYALSCNNKDVDLKFQNKIVFFVGVILTILQISGIIK